MAILDDVLSQIAAAIGPRGVDQNDPNQMPRLRPRAPVAIPGQVPSPQAPAGMYGYSRAGRGDDGMYMGAAVPSLPNPAPDDRYGAERRAAEYADPHDATHHLRDANWPGQVTGTVKQGGTGSDVAGNSLSWLRLWKAC